MQLSTEGHRFVTITLVASRGSAPQDPGAKAIVTEKGLHWGTVGGGKIEARAIQFARALISSGSPQDPSPAQAKSSGPILVPDSKSGPITVPDSKSGPRTVPDSKSGPRIVTWNLQTDIGMTCGGEVTYLFETHFPRHWKIVVFGAGHVSQALIRVLLTLECQIQCYDHRPEWLEKLPSSEKLTAVCIAQPEELVPQLHQRSFFVSVTQGHAMDVPILEKIFRHHPEAPYIGVIGSDLKAKRIRAELSARGVSDSLLQKLRCPMGLPLGSNSPAEIAISIAAELLQVRT